MRSAPLLYAKTWLIFADPATNVLIAVCIEPVCISYLGHADVDLKVQKCPCVKHGNVLGKYSHVINMGLF